jgi:outer membrane protein assembly factor BamB
MRRTLFLTLVALTLSTSLAVAADWPRYRGPNNDGIAEDAKLSKLSLTQAWKVPVGDSFGQIAVVGNKAFLMAERSGDEVCLCLDAATGKELWATRVDKTIKDGNGNGPRSTPFIDGKFVYVLGTYLKLMCLDLDSGKEVWSHNLEKEHGAKILTWGSASSPQVIGDVVLVTGGSAGKGISAFNKTTGQLAWAKTDEQYTHSTPTVATIKGKLQAICLMKSGFVSVDPANGDVLWTYPISKAASAGAVAASPIVGGKDGDLVFYSIGYNVGGGACRVSNDGGKWTAKELWTTSGTKVQTTWSTAVYRDGYIYGLFGHNADNGPLACLDIETGNIKWSQSGFGSQGGLILSGDKLLVQTVKGDLVLVPAAPDAFKELGRTTVLPGKDWTAPTLANNLLFVRNSSAKTGAGTAEIACYKLAN